MRKIIKKLLYIVLTCLVIYAINSFLYGKTKNIPIVTHFIILVFGSVILLSLYDFFMMIVGVELSCILHKKSVENIENIRIINALRCIKMDYIISFIMYYLRLHWVNTSHGKTNDIYYYIRYFSFKYKIETLIKLVLCPPILISGVYVFVLKNNLEMYDFYFLKKITGLSIAGIKIENAWNYFEKIPLLISIFPLLFIFYFVGNRARIKTIISKKENEKKKIVIYKIFELSSYLEECLYEMSQNVDRLIRRQNFIADQYLHNKIENYYEISNRKYFSSIVFCTDFDEIKRDSEIDKIVKELFCRDNIEYFNEFSFYSYRFRVLYFALSYDYAYYFGKNINRRTSLDLLLNPSKYIKDDLHTSKDSSKRKATDDYEKLLSEEKSCFTPKLYDALKLLFYIGLFVNEFNRFISCDSMEALIKEVVKKSK